MLSFAQRQQTTGDLLKIALLTIVFISHSIKNQTINGTSIPFSYTEFKIPFMKLKKYIIICDSNYLKTSI